MASHIRPPERNRHLNVLILNHSSVVRLFLKRCRTNTNVIQACGYQQPGTALSLLAASPSASEKSPSRSRTQERPKCHFKLFSNQPFLVTNFSRVAGF